jgi:endonuclease/exonuclease/phosphatase family metal-dependent hydrolase
MNSIAEMSSLLFARRRPPRRYVAGLIFLSLAGFETTSSAAVHYVSPDGSAAPEAGQASRPWQLVEAAARALPAGGGTLSISPGLYREKFVLDRPAVLIAPKGGAVIGDLTTGIAATTTFHVFTWNTHLFGDYLLLPSWQDYQRAEEMGTYFARRYNDLDLISLCEVWDEDLFLGGDGAVGMRPQSGYHNWMIFPDIKPGVVTCAIAPSPRILHSGLALMTKHPMSDLRRVHYEDCDGDCPGISESPDCLASKGFMATTVVKDAFSIRVYSTHTQAGNGTDPTNTRQKQIMQLARDVRDFRAANPSQAVLVMGDLNVVGDTTGDYAFLRDQMAALNGHDAARNAAKVSSYQDPSIAYTLTSFNELAIKFDPHPYNQRLDYIWYFPSLDGTIQVQPIRVERLLVHGAVRTEDGLTSDELSDHYPLEASFLLIRTL